MSDQIPTKKAYMGNGSINQVINKLDIICMKNRMEYCMEKMLKWEKSEKYGRKFYAYKTLFIFIAIPIPFQ